MIGMTTTDLSTDPSVTGEDGPDAAARLRPGMTAFAAGSASAVLSAAIVLLIVLVVAVPGSGGGWDRTVGTGVALWLLMGGARLRVDGVVVAFTPLLGTLLLVLLAWAAASRVLPRPGPGRVQLTSWCLGYAAASASVTALTAFTPIQPVSWTLALPALGVPAAAAVLLVLRRGRSLPVITGWLPRGLRRGVRPGLEGAALLVLVGSVLVVVMVVSHVAGIAHVTDELGARGPAAAALSAAQALALPNGAVWAVSWLAGPGFSVAEGAQVTWAGAHSSLMPMVPALAAVPAPGAFPAVTRLVGLLPVIAGAVVGWRALARLPLLAPTRAKLAVTTTAVAVAVCVLVLLDVLGGGSLGAARMASIGAPGPALGLALAAEMGLGAAIVVLRDWWLLRR